MTDYVDWDFAKRTAGRIAPPGPDISPEEASEVVAHIHELAATAVEPVAATSLLRAPGEAPAPLVVDRPTWIDVNADSMSAMLEPAMERMSALRDKPVWGPAASVGGKVTATEAGSMLAFLSTKVLGQYDIAPGGTPALLLVAPNIVATERRIKAVPRDFRLWVCLHEETHRVQFTAVPWLRQHMIDGSRQLLTEIVPEPGAVPARLQEIATRLLGSVKDGGDGLADVFVNEEQRDRIAAMTAVMSLLEGHADVVMDDVGPQIVPSVEEIRRTFNERRKGAGNVDRLLRRLLGLEAKMRQYRDGAAFCRAVMDKVGVDGFNEVWTSPETLPSAREILEPSLWVERVHGSFIR